MNMDLMEQMADMILEEMVKTGDKDAIAMKSLKNIRKKHIKVMNYFGGIIGNNEKTDKITEFATKINEQFDEFMKEEGIEHGNKNNE